MGRIVRRSKLPGKETRQGLHLIAAGKEREFFGIGLTNTPKTLAEHVKGLVPGNGIVLAFATIGAWPTK